MIWLRRLLWILIGGALLFDVLFLFFFLLGWAGYLFPLCRDMPPSPRYQAGVVLSAEQAPISGHAIGQTVLRLRAGLDLLDRGIVPELVMSGGHVANPDISLGAAMKDWAVERGMARPDQLLVEGRSLSTLENALYSAPMLPARFVVVSEGFHLVRSWASFLWAGRVPSAMCRADSFPPLRRRVVGESLKWGFNILRGGVYSAARLVGVQGRLPAGFLN